jgi:uncharacterized cupredoxin-like copper-binding protein
MDCDRERGRQTLWEAETMTVATEPVTPSQSSSVVRRENRRRGWRDLRFMLVTVAVLLIGSMVAVAIAYAVKGSSGPAGDVQASTVDYKVLIPTTLKTGKHTIGYTNNGKVPHEIVIFKTALSANNLPLNADGDVNEDSPLLTNVADSGDALKPGGTKSFTTSSLTPGHYVAVCNLPGHYHLGMKINVTVS